VRESAKILESSTLELGKTAKGWERLHPHLSKQVLLQKITLLTIKKGWFHISISFWTLTESLEAKGDFKTKPCPTQQRCYFRRIQRTP
jgi:hypothetical protein